MSSLQDIFIKLEGIDGESKDGKHKNWIDVLSFGYSVSQSSSAFTGGGSGVGKASFDSLSFTHYVDKTSPNLFMYCALGKHIPKVELSCCKSGGGSQEYMRITLDDVIVTSVSPSGANSDTQVKESVNLSYAKIKIEAKEQKADGSMGPAVTGAWNVKENKQA
ncbi:MAG: type VI secretion system tube protein Hcp [Betaproteobacteria bacterium]|jgi:type VI secretion system secreted protein Hcp|nr:type VI secretion system tube protein Hcp [Betaproteobacteria bacterium]